MSRQSGPSFLRTSIGRLAVTGAATLVTVTGFAPAASATDDDLAPESGAPDASSQSLPGTSTPSVDDPAADEAVVTPPPAEQEAPPVEETPPVEEETPPVEETPPTEDEAPAEEGAGASDDAPAEDEPGTGTDEVAVAAAQLTLVDDSADVVEGRTVSVDVLGNDSSDDRIRSLTIDDQGEHGTAYVVGSRFDQPGQSVPGEGSLRLEFDADEDFTGEDTVTYRVTTEDGTTATATVDIDVQEYVAPPVEATFGTQKIRVGVQLADGSYVPEGTTTAGSVIRIEERPQGGGDPVVTTCTTQPFVGPETESACNQFTGNAGSTYVFTQQSAPAGVVPSTRRFVVDPCVSSPIVIDGVPLPFDGCNFLSTTDLTFVATGSILPEANDDAAASRGGRAVDVDVLANDTSDDPNTTLQVDEQPRGGTAEVVGEADRPDPEPDPQPGPGDVDVLAVPTAGSQVVRYTPEPGFEGIDDFTYRLTNGNGSDTATVTVAVSDNGAVTPIEPEDDRDGDDTDDRSLAGSGSGVVPASIGSTLPRTGGPDAGLLVLGVALVTAGAAAAAGSRRRRDVAGG